MRISSNGRFIALALVSGFLLLTPFLSVKAITVSPVRLELNGDPGSTVGGSFKVFNDEAETKRLYTVFENFEASGETGSPSFRTGDDGLASWITAPESFEVAAGDSETIDFAITIPQSAEAGGYFAAIFVATAPPSSNPNELAIGSRVGTLLLFRVNGNIIEDGSLLEFATKNNKKWHNALPINFFYRFQNSGADRVFPKSSLTVKNIFGRTTTVLDANLAEGNVLPGSIRRFEVWWSKDDNTKELIPKPMPSDLSFIQTIKYQWKNFAFGKYTTDLDITYGSQDERVGKSFSVYVFPWQLIVVVLFILLIGFFLIRFIITRYNKWVIKRYRS